jgi:hypothetical protein
MDGQFKKTPIKWSVKGNIAPGEVSNPPNLTPFTFHNCTGTLETGVTVEGKLLKPIKTTPAF